LAVASRAAGYAVMCGRRVGPDPSRPDSSALKGCPNCPASSRNLDGPSAAGQFQGYGVANHARNSPTMPRHQRHSDRRKTHVEGCRVKVDPSVHPDQQQARRIWPTQRKRRTRMLFTPTARPGRWVGTWPHTDLVPARTAARVLASACDTHIRRLWQDDIFKRTKTSAAGGGTDR